MLSLKCVEHHAEAVSELLVNSLPHSCLETRRIKHITAIDRINTLVLIQCILEGDWVDFCEVERHASQAGCPGVERLTYCLTYFQLPMTQRYKKEATHKLQDCHHHHHLSFLLFEPPIRSRSSNAKYIYICNLYAVICLKISPLRTHNGPCYQPLCRPGRDLTLVIT